MSPLVRMPISALLWVLVIALSVLLHLVCFNWRGAWAVASEGLREWWRELRGH